MEWGLPEQSWVKPIWSNITECALKVYEVTTSTPEFRRITGGKNSFISVTAEVKPPIYTCRRSIVTFVNTETTKFVIKRDIIYIFQEDF